ncbi:MAG TPA: methyltransferase domain-containing protein [Candidatus Saccharimonadales bacterium]|nr:methyltransferase domain-containing protein [Candidatus Saccharimonadales bacterium]
MNIDQELAAIPRGRTCRGVNKVIIQYLLGLKSDFNGQWLLDIPCGDGTLLETIRHFFPKACLRGADIAPPGQSPHGNYAAVDASKPFSIFPELKFNLVLSISGVLEFDNTLQFLQTLRQHLGDKGILIVSNDNVMGVRDRLEFFLFGKVKHPYDIFVVRNQSSWKVTPIHNFVRNLEDSGFKIKEIKYIPVLPKDLLLLPLALLIYPIQSLYICMRKTAMPLWKRRMMYPFVSLLSRHYLIISERD